jgi:amino-acid N-acetyltransferase
MIRKATTDDTKVIYALLLEGVSSGKVLKRSTNELKNVIDSFFVYLEDNKVVGCCSLEIYTQKLAEIRSLVVSVEYRNRGIGSALVTRCLAEAKNKKIYQVLSVTDKHDLFQRYGFRNQIDEKQAMFLKLGQKGGKLI